ncbi:MAG: transporter [Methylococcaceae bacterium]|nr:MAG: transporter [Methylococcaceae bacterium]
MPFPYAARRAEDAFPRSAWERVKQSRYLLLLLASLASPAWPDDEPEATPYRPTVSNPAQLSTPGYFEMELGWERIQGGSDNRRKTGLPALLKYAFTEDIGIMVGSTLHNDQTGYDGYRVTGAGDTSLVLKQKWDMSETTALGLELSAMVPSAKPGIGDGKTNYTANGIYSMDIAGNAIDINVGLTSLGAISPGESRYLWAWQAAIDHPLTERWGVALEFSGTARDEAHPTTQILVSSSYQVHRRVVLDAGMSRGMTHASQDWSAFAGITVLVGKAW